MGKGEQGRTRDAVQVIAAATLIALGVLVAVLGLTDSELGAAGLIAAAIAVLAGLAAVAAWWQERRDSAHAAGESAAAAERLRTEDERKRTEIDELRDEFEARITERDREAVEARNALQEERERRERDRQEAEQRQREQDEKFRRERDLRIRVERVRSAEHEWNRELRTQVVRMHRERGDLAEMDDIRQLVLRMAVVLVEAGGGILMSRKDEDGDGSPLDVVAHEGFDNDPTESAVAKAFASQVIEADETVREDNSRAIEREGRNAADEEIDNLVAIPIYIADDFHGVVVCVNRDGGFEECDDEVLLALGDHAGAVLENSRLHGALRTSYLSTVAMLAEVIEAKDPFLRGHSDEVSRYVSAVADRLGIERRRREQLVFGSLLHDVGKVGISERILLKPAALTQEERSIIQLHPRIGYRLVERVPALRDIAPAILHHHERYDGEGYPSRLAGDEIPLEARIICVADSFSAMTAERPYRGRMSLSDACAELERCAGTQFDPEVVRIFVEEVRARPISEDDEAVAAALAADPELQIRRDDNEPLLGHGPLAVTDNLTLLYSHRYFHEFAGKEAERARMQDDSFGIVLIEAVDIAGINARDGYAAGDDAIRAIANAVQRVAIRVGGTACRYSGRRIGLIAPGADDAQVARLASEISAELGESPRVECGEAAWRPGESGEDVIGRARLGLTHVNA